MWSRKTLEIVNTKNKITKIIVRSLGRKKHTLKFFVELGSIEHKILIHNENYLPCILWLKSEGSFFGMNLQNLRNTYYKPTLFIFSIKDDGLGKVQ